MDIVLIAAVVEELFYRDLALRFATDPDDLRRVPVGRFSPLAFVLSTALFTVSHPEWLAAAVFAASLGVLLWRTKSLFACVAAHAATHLLLGAYIVVARDWRFW